MKIAKAWFFGATLLFNSGAIPVLAQQSAWNYQAAGAVHLANTTTEGYNLVVACQDRKAWVTVNFEIPKTLLHPALKKALYGTADQPASVGKKLGRAYLHIMIDHVPDKVEKKLPWVETNFTDDGDAVRIALVGRALEYIRQIGGARDNITLGISVEKPVGAYDMYNSASFQPAGAKVAIKTALDACGFKY